MWIVAIDRPHYPYVYKFDTYDEAKKFYDSEILSIEDAYGAYDCAVYIAEVKHKTPFKGAY